MENTVAAKKGIPGSTLKLIAIITMLIDHIGAVILERILTANDMVYLIFRLIGRLGFPIFCFLLIEGFLHTRNVWKYVFRLFLFSIISEIPFNLAFRNMVLNEGYQNVFFTLLFGLLALIFIQIAETKLKSNKVLQYLLIIPISVVFMLIAEFLFRCDYGAMGILTIIIMYLLRKNRIWEMAGGCIVLTILNFLEITSFFTLIPISKYNGERGLKLKYVFYAFYPVHLLILYLIAHFMGL